jgi:hypothetical protein
LPTGRINVGGKSVDINTLTPKGVIQPGQQVEIPNTIVAWWAGDLDDFGKSWVAWEKDLKYLRSLGFYVVEVNGNNDKFMETAESLSQHRSLYGIFVMGHGSKTTLGSEKTGFVYYYGEEYEHEGVEVHIPGLAPSLHYGLGFVLLNTCNSAEGANILKAEAASFKGCEKLCNGGNYGWVADIYRFWTNRCDPSAKAQKNGNGYDDVTHPQEVIKPGQAGTKAP